MFSPEIQMPAGTNITISSDEIEFRLVTVKLHHKLSDN